MENKRQTLTILGVPSSVVVSASVDGRRDFLVPHVSRR
jgi:hypothetical protein